MRPAHMYHDNFDHFQTLELFQRYSTYLSTIILPETSITPAITTKAKAVIRIINNMSLFSGIE